MPYARLGYSDHATWGGKTPCPENETGEEIKEEQVKFSQREVKEQILCWFKIGYNAEKIIKIMRKFGWFELMTDSSVKRFERAILKKAECDEKF